MKRIIILALLSITIISCNDNLIGKNYELDYNPNEEINLINKQKSENGYDVISISGHILFYGHSNEYIIVIQKPQDSIYNFKENLNHDQMMKKVFESNFIQFWILEVKKDQLLGPFQKSEYLEKRKELGIPDNLKINYSTKEFYLKDQRNDIQYINPDSDVIDIKNLKGNMSK